MKLIADSGSTKTDWVLIDSHNQIAEFKTRGLNPYFVDSDTVSEVVSSMNINQEAVSSIHFYGAGCSINDKIKVISDGLKEVFPESELEINSDLLGAARALFKKEKGLACILGTGSNAGVYNGKEFTDKIKSLGYILGDEGSGSSIGKDLVTSWIRKEMPQELISAFNEKYNTSYEEIIDKVYRKQSPNTFLASFAKFAGEHNDHYFIKELVKNRMNQFFKYQIKPLKSQPDYKIGIIGSIAVNFENIINESANKYGFEVKKIIDGPIKNLKEYHSIY